MKDYEEELKVMKHQNCNSNNSPTNENTGENSNDGMSSLNTGH